MIDADQAARRLIAELWKENTFGGTTERNDSAARKNLQGALELLSTQFYNTETHFLLELIQNADDNVYEHPRPELNFSYKKGSLRVDCNEAGFTESDVRAICQISQSTKADLRHSNPRTGEKGIGFKSVFTVAAVVYISSGPYSFRFDKSEAFGMLAPEWAEFPARTLPGYTSFYLQLADGCDEAKIARDLQNMESTLLLFTRRLRHINISILQEDGTTWTGQLRKEARQENGRPITLLYRGSETARYDITEYRVPRMPTEHSRRGCLQSNILLAFPSLNGDETLTCTTRPVHAVLPIRDYGFRFHLQADFILTANRQEVRDIPWNQALREASADAYMRAIANFNSGDFRHTWPRYLPSGHIDGFFKPLKNLIIRKLKQQPILESFAGTMHPPALLTHVPQEYCMGPNGTPLTVFQTTQNSYLSSNYSAEDSMLLYCLGTKTLNARSFIDDLVCMITTEPEVFRQKPCTWQSHLAKVLTTLIGDSQIMARVRQMKLIPLRTGEWTSVVDGPIHFGGMQAQDLVTPETLFPRTVEAMAESDCFRRILFAYLGVQNRPDPAEICRRIIAMHACETFDPQGFTPSQLLSHVLFIFKASFLPPTGTDMWFATRKNQRVKGSCLYLPNLATAETPTSRLMRSLGKKFPFIHGDYIGASPRTQAWRDWLQEYLGVASLPRLSASVPDKLGTYGMSEEFRYLFEVCESSDVLDMLKVHWRRYEGQIRSHHWDQMSEANARSLRQQIQLTKVKCYRGKEGARCSSFLKKAFLPGLDKVVDEWSQVPKLILHDPKDPLWHILSNFDVSIAANQDYYVRCLSSMRLDQPPKKIVEHIYQRLQGYLHSDKGEEIRMAFSNQNLIYTTASSTVKKQMVWLRSSECVQHGHDVASEYPSCQLLFSSLIKAKQPMSDLLIQALTDCSPETKLCSRRELLVNISRTLKLQKRDDAIKALKPLYGWKAVFPVICNWDEAEYHALRPLRPEFPPWFIADTEQLRESFRGHVELLAWPPEDLNSIDCLLELLDLESRRLSRLVESKQIPVGKLRFSKRHTTSLRQKASYITALIPKSRQSRADDVRQFNQVEVNAVTRIAQKYQFNYGKRVFSGHEVEGQVSFTIENRKLQVCMKRNNMSASTPPPELSKGIIDLYGIVNPVHCNLLQFALVEGHRDRIREAFRREGIYVKHGDYDALGRDSFLDKDSDDEEEEEVPEDKLRTNFNYVPTNFGDDDEKQFDRLLPLKSFKWSGQYLFRSVSTDPCMDHKTILRKEPAHIQYLAEAMASDTLAFSDRRNVFSTNTIQTSQLFHWHISEGYDAEKHWTSPLRVRSGHSAFEGTPSTHASFTIGDLETEHKITKFLVGNGGSDITQIAQSAEGLIYHFDIAATPNGPTSSFPWTSQQLERMRRFRVNRQPETTQECRPQGVHVLIRISNVFDDPSFQLFVDPWRLILSHRFVLRDDWTFTAAIEDSEEAHSHRTVHHTDSATTLASGLTQQDKSLPHTRRTRPLVVNGSWTNMSPSTLMGLGSTTAMQGPRPLLMKCPSPGQGTAPNYSFKTLKAGEIRLLILYPGSTHDILRAAVSQSPLRQTSSFQAISYTWGNTELSQTLWTPEGSIKITESLYDALRSLRHEKAELLLWADGICINQVDLKEKAEQIRLMPHVFQRATCVLIFLGSDADGEAAVEALMQIRVNEALKDLDEQWPKDLAPMPSHWNEKPTPPENDGVWSDIEQFFDRRWFRRAWVIQEAIAAISVRVICGKWMVDWNDLFIALEVIKRDRKPSYPELRVSSGSSWDSFLTLAQQREREAQHDRRPLLELLESFRYAESTEERDRFFCLLGMAEDGNNEGFIIDYQIPFGRLVRKYAWTFIGQGMAMELLHHAGTSQRPTKQFPSWIPDWTAKRQNSLRSLASQGMPCAASWCAEPRIKSDPANEFEFELGVHGAHIDKIKDVSKFGNLMDELSAYLDEVERMCHRATSRLDKNARWEIPIASATRRRVEGPGMKESYEALREYLKRGGNKPPSSRRAPQTKNVALKVTNKELWERAQNYVLALQDCLSGWKFIETKKGLVGVAPPAAWTGDSICILDGGVVPFVLRKSAEVRGDFELIGECYIHGLMNGEGAQVGANDSLIVLR